MSTEILTEAGTNELEIIEFKVGREFYGVNVAKVGEVINYISEISKYPKAHKEIEGMLNYRGVVMPVVNMFSILDIEEEEYKKMMLVTKFNNRTICFIVGEVVGIHKDSWKNIDSAEDFMSTKDGEQYITGILKKKGDLISLVDFESIISRLLGENMLYNLGSLEETIKSEKQIVFAEDSSMIAKVLKDNLVKIGFDNIKSFNNGEDLWNYLSGNKESKNEIYCILSDIEMPKMDGLTLCKKVKGDNNLKDLKVVLFSSLITDELRNKGESVGADAQISKPDMDELLQVLKKINE